MKRILASILLFGLLGHAMSQGDYEAFRFSQTDYQGTARYIGAGGAFSSTGGDFSALYTNPAAIALYKRNEVTITPLVVSFSKNNSLYYGNSVYTQSPKYTVPQCGLVIAKAIENSNWKMWQFGFGYNRIIDYNNLFRVSGSANNTMINTILNHVNGTPYNSLSGDGALAFNTWMIDTLPGMPSTYSTPFANTTTQQDGLVKTSGAIDEISFTFGGNFKDQLFIGGAIGVPVIDFTEKISYQEEVFDEETLNRGIASFKTNSTQHNTGAGINLKLGIIYQATNFLRIGVGFQSPTYYWKIKDNFNRDMISYYTNGSNSGSFNFDNYYKFSLTTPLKLNASATFLINKCAFISAEYEFSDYSMAKLYANDYSFIDENEAIQNKYGAIHTVRIGGEVNLSQSFLLRAGYNYKTSPYKQIETAYNGSAHYGAVGLGYHSKYFFFDMAYVIRFMKDSVWLYDTTDAANVVKNSNTTHRIVATIGCKF